jgi:hypothetical protein
MAGANELLTIEPARSRENRERLIKSVGVVEQFSEGKAGVDPDAHRKVGLDQLRVQALELPLVVRLVPGVGKASVRVGQRGIQLKLVTKAGLPLLEPTECPQYLAEPGPGNRELGVERKRVPADRLAVVRIAGVDRRRGQQEMHHCVVGPQRGGLAMACHRLVVAGEFGQHAAKIAERLGPVRLQCQRSAQCGLRLVEAALARETDAKVDEGIDERRHQLDGAGGVFHGLLVGTLHIEQRAQIAARHRQVGLQRNGGPVACRRFGQPTHGPQGIAEVHLAIREPGQARERPRNKLDGVLVPPSLVRDDAEDMQRVDVVRHLLEHLTV